MMLAAYVREGIRRIRIGGLTAVRDILAQGYYRVFHRMDGVNVYDEDWDVLVVLDACRADVLQEVADDYPWIEDAGSIVSVGGHSREWMRATVAGAPADELADTAYVTGNPFSSEMDLDDVFGVVDEVWRYAWDDDLGGIPPRPLTDRAVEIARSGDVDRVIVHYMQPHFPSIVASAATDGIALDEWGDRGLFIWDEVRAGRRSADEAWEMYRDNLRAVLDDVDLLRRNVDGDRLVITGDHGNAFGEDGMYGHAPGVNHPSMREVPWAVVTPRDTGDHDPAGYDRGGDVEIRERLQDLGYM